MRLLKVGRDSSCDIVLQSPKASALHAEITILNSGDILLEDKNSTNGTFIMNRPIKPGAQVNIKRGDAIRFGDVELIWDQVPAPENNSEYKAVYGIGSNFRNEIQISGNTVSRFHATLKIDKKGHATLLDHSKNGTTVNGMPLRNGQTVKIQKKDAVVCGGIPVNLDQYLPNQISTVILKAAACAAVVAGLVFGVVKVLDIFGTVHPKTTVALENATACVYGGYYYVVTIKDDPFKLILKDFNWPEQLYLGINNGQLDIAFKTDHLRPIEYTGTAFFISENGEMGTNRHIAAPWEYRTAFEEEDIRQLVTKLRQSKELRELLESLEYVMESAGISDEDIYAWLTRYIVSDFEISGIHEYFGVGLTGTRVNNILDLLPCQVKATSEDDKKDVALIRLNSAQTPEKLIKMGAIFEIEKARLDERELKPQSESLITIGYPSGTFDGTELHPTMHQASLSKMPDDNIMQIQTVAIGGQSGSPVFDKKNRLVGVLFAGNDNTEVTYCCNIKHLKALYDAHRVRE